MYILIFFVILLTNTRHDKLTNTRIVRSLFESKHFIYKWEIHHPPLEMFVSQKELSLLIRFYNLEINNYFFKLFLSLNLHGRWISSIQAVYERKFYWIEFIPASISGQLRRMEKKIHRISSRRFKIKSICRDNYCMLGLNIISLISCLSKSKLLKIQIIFYLY